MEEVDSEALADVAYGIFEHLLTRTLQEKGKYLYALVEGGLDFTADLNETFQKFGNEYPQLAEALNGRFESVEKIYALLCAGEGVVPSRTTQMYWIVQDAPGSAPEAIEDEHAGKWLIFQEPDAADDAWKKVRDATVSLSLGISAKVSTAKPNPDSRDNRRVIYVYTKDWADEADVMRVREHLKSLGFVDRIGYKRNLETFAGEYAQKGKRVTYYSA
ncbi:putative phosphothreonine lyase domain-containg protein [Methanoregula sp. UBA64]|uniref:putative phosphothreonine lyase domain-containing protein n=1 Tax=Methanoregula sp. UBA64 TaxID=1915554 RepID=UPI0025ED2964|nr:putative phosphothreonine lyase domain-containg protein [Methanoregula sp. UBA64]